MHPPTQPRKIGPVTIQSGETQREERVRRCLLAFAGNMLFTRATKLAKPVGSGIYIQRYFAFLRRERKAQSAAGVEKKKHISLIFGFKGKLICPRAYPHRGLQTTTFSAQALLHNNSQHLSYHPAA